MSELTGSSDVTTGVVQALAVYAAAVDSRSVERIAAVLTPGVRLTRGAESYEGVEAFLEAYRPFLESDILASRHVITNHVVEQTGPASAVVRSCFEATMFGASGTRRVIGTYVDDLVVVDGVWLIDHKRNIVEWSLDLPPATRL